MHFSSYSREYRTLVPDRFLDSLLRFKGSQGLSHRAVQGEDKPAARRMYVDTKLCIVRLEIISFYFIADYSKLPSQVTVDVCYLLDPLIATGGTACAALQMLLDWGLPSELLFIFFSAYLIKMISPKYKTLVCPRLGDWPQESCAGLPGARGSCLSLKF